MNTFAKRLQIAIDKRGFSQTQAAKICEITQQSMNYIISNDLKSSKLAPQIAAALKINPEWLILGQGKFEENKIYELPILHSAYMLKKYLNNAIDENTLDYTVININLGNLAFAYLMETNKMIICATSTTTATQSETTEYLTIQGLSTEITKEKKELSFPIYEWRIRYVDY